MKKKTLWTKNYTLLNLSTVFSAAGGIAGNYAISFLVYDETGSTLAAGLLLGLQVIPFFLLPLAVAPWMDRFPRKPFLVLGDFIGGILYILAVIYLRNQNFSYLLYLVFSLITACIGALDSLSYNSIFPSVIPEGFEEKGYAVSGVLYPVMNVVIMPLAAVLMDTIGVARILILQGVFAIIASFVENNIHIREEVRAGTSRGLLQWWSDFLEGFQYLKQERGLVNLLVYRGISNGVAIGLGPVLVAFFRTSPGMSAFLYSFFSVAECIGRSIAGVVQYHITIPKKKRFFFTFLVYQIYDLMDAVLLWIPYPFMLMNRALCGFLGNCSATLRETAVQVYIPEHYRARVNAFQEALISACGSVLALVIGLVGEYLDYRSTMTLCGSFCVFVCWITVWRNRRSIRKIYEGDERT